MRGPVEAAGGVYALAIERLDAELLLPGRGEPWHGTPAAAVARARAAG